MPSRWKAGSSPRSPRMTTQLLPATEVCAMAEVGKTVQAEVDAAELGQGRARMLPGEGEPEVAVLTRRQIAAVRLIERPAALEHTDLAGVAAERRQDQHLGHGEDRGDPAVGLADGLVRHRQLDALRLERRDHLAPLEAGPGQDGRGRRARAGRQRPSRRARRTRSATSPPLISTKRAPCASSLRWTKLRRGRSVGGRCHAHRSSHRPFRRAAMTRLPKRPGFRLSSTTVSADLAIRAPLSTSRRGPMMRVMD